MITSLSIYLCVDFDKVYFCEEKNTKMKLLSKTSDM